MVAIPQRHLYQLENSITKLGEKWINFHNVGFSHAEFLTMFAPEGHWEFLNSASEIAEVNASGGWRDSEFNDPRFTEAFGSSHVRLMFQVHLINNRAPLMPRNKVILASIPQDVRDKLTSWVIERTEIMFNINRVRAVLSWLSTHCDSGPQIRFLWPSIIALASLNESTHDLGDRLRELRPPRSLPALPSEVKAGCRMASTTIASAMLLGEPEAFTAPVTCTILRVDAQRKEGALGILNGA